MLVVGLDAHSRRDLLELEPRGNDTLMDMGLCQSKIDGPMRAWINKRFRKPGEELESGSLTITTRFSRLCAVCGA
ncbi:MAG: hypothetical protein Q8R02_08735 [Hyphomonadaceae bacterium]|nr:hypothetical protein [Hyphomonadaceae bacterium]